MNRQSNLISNEDISLFNRLRTGDYKVFDALYDRYHPMVYSLAMFYLKNSDQAQDAVQSVFMKLWEQRNTIELHSSLKNYIFTSTRNYILNFIRFNQLAVTKNYELAQEAPLSEELEFRLHQNEDLMILEQAIEKLPPAQRQVIRLKLTEELQYQEMAKRMNISINTVKSHYQAALKSLRKLLLPRIEFILLLYWII